jgi:cytochrome c-type biogenesis protein CcmF
MNDTTPLNLPIASNAAIFAGDLGRFFIWAGVVLFAVTLIQNLFFASAKKVGSVSFIAGCLSIFGAFITLGGLFVTSQFEFGYVAEHSQISDPIQYKIAAIWAGQQGSFLLWATTSSIFALFTIRGTGIYRRWYTVAYASLLVALCGILAYETPFVLTIFHGQPYIPPDGQGLNASLQNYWVIIHPPTIFMGFGSLTVLFAYAFSALVTKQYQEWSRLVRPWALVSLSILGIGLCMGGFWAYETLGWGGFWKWDPVENTSFVPWCFVVALVHGLIVQGTRKKWSWSNLMLAGLPFILFVYGTFLTRAGFLDGVSVHSFAQMDHTAHMVLLTFCILTAAGFTALWTWRWMKHPATEDKSIPDGSREGWYRFGSIFIVLLGTATAFGMSVPLVQVLSNQKPKVVEEHLYHIVLAWFFIPIIVMMAVAPFVSWRKMSFGQLMTRLANILSVTIGALGILMLIINNPTYGVHMAQNSWTSFPFHYSVSTLPWITFLIGLCLFAGIANFWRICELWKRSKPSIGAFIAHIGIATAMAGLIISRGLERTQTYAMQEGSSAMPYTTDGGTSLLPYTLTLNEVDTKKLGDKENKLNIETIGDGGKFMARPGFYFIPNANGDPQQFAWPSIHHEISHDTYIAMRGSQDIVDDPISLKPGETKDFMAPNWQTGLKEDYKISYVKLEREGEVGTVGTKFFAQLVIQLPDGTKIPSAPGMAIASGGGGPQMIPGQIDDHVFVTLASMDAGSHSVMLQFNYVRPLYEADLIYKPMVILVWAGAGILTFGGLLSAWYRRRVTKALDDVEPSTP